MELLPTTEDGLRLSVLLQEWTENSSENATEILQRILFMYSCQIVNEDTFISSLYGQNVLNDPPVELVIVTVPFHLYKIAMQAG